MGTSLRILWGGVNTVVTSLKEPDPIVPETVLPVDWCPDQTLDGKVMQQMDCNHAPNRPTA